MNINIKFQHIPSMNHKNGNEQIMGTELSGNPIKATNIYSHLKNKSIYNMW